MYSNKNQRGRDKEITKSNNHRQFHRSTSNNPNHEIPSTSKGKIKNWEFTKHKIIGKGTFGIVYFGTINITNEQVAIKRVLQDENYKNRELDILKQLEHPNIVKLNHYYFSRQLNSTDQDKVKNQSIYLYLIMQYIPQDLFKIIKYFHKSQRKSFPNILIKLYSYQLLRALAYLKYCGVCHRDIKPRNILIDTKSNQLKICDFGSAKKLVKGQPNLAYVCSRYYRAPQLAFGNTNYNTKSDMWSTGCVIAEMFLGEPLFFAETTVDHLAKIFSLIGTPSEAQLKILNPQAKHQYNFPKFKGKKFSKILPKADPLLCDLLQRIFIYNFEERSDPFQMLFHPYFEELKTCKINGIQPNFLYNFSQVQKIFYKELIKKLNINQNK